MTRDELRRSLAAAMRPGNSPVGDTIDAMRRLVRTSPVPVMSITMMTVALSQLLRRDVAELVDDEKLLARLADVGTVLEDLAAHIGAVSFETEAKAGASELPAFSLASVREAIHAVETETLARRRFLVRLDAASGCQGRERDQAIQTLLVVLEMIGKKPADRDSLRAAIADALDAWSGVRADLGVNKATNRPKWPVVNKALKLVGLATTNGALEQVWKDRDRSGG